MGKYCCSELAELEEDDFRIIGNRYELGFEWEWVEIKYCPFCGTEFVNLIDEKDFDI